MRQRVSVAITSRTVFVSVPSVFSARIRSVYSPSVSIFPERMPFSVSRNRSTGSLSIEKVIGRAPVVGIRHKIGLPTEAPYVPGACIFGLPVRGAGVCATFVYIVVILSLYL